jgi:hypothetical protein
MRGHLVVEAGPALFWALCISSIESWVDTCRRPAQGVPSMQQVVEIDSISPVSPHSPASLPPVRVVVPVEGQEPIMRDARLPPFSLSARHTDSLPPPRLAAASDDMPLLVAKLEEDARSREALMRIGYLKALAAYLRHKRNGDDTFGPLGGDRLQPTMEFVRDWLKEQRRRVISRYRTTFLLSLCATLAAGVAFLGTLMLLAR